MAQPIPDTPNILALLFTDAQGMVIFADNRFLKLFRYAEAGAVVGEPLYQVLRTDSKAINHLIRAISESGYVHDMPISVQTMEGEFSRILCTGVATYDDRNMFIGADITLRSQAATSDLPLTHEDSLSTHIQQVQDEAASLDSQNLLQVYVAAQLGAVDILLARLGGPKVRKTLTDLANKKAEKVGLPLYMENGEIHLNCTAGEKDYAPCSAVFEEVIKYASSVIGRRMVLAEMKAVDSRMDIHTQEVAEQAGLRKILNSR